MNRPVSQTKGYPKTNSVRYMNMPGRRRTRDGMHDTWARGTGVEKENFRWRGEGGEGHRTAKGDVNCVLELTGGHDTEE